MGDAYGLAVQPARALAAAGAKVAILDFDEQRGESIASELAGIFCRVGVTDEASLDAGFAKARDPSCPGGCRQVG